MKYYALIDGEIIVQLGECESFEEADNKAPGNTVWILDDDIASSWFRQLKAILEG